MPRLLLFLCLACASVASRALDLRMLIAWDDSYAGVDHVAERFARKVDDETKGEVRIILSGPDSIPPFHQVEPVALGIFDLVLTHGSFHLDTTGIGLALDALRERPTTLRRTGVWDAVDRAYQAKGLKLLALPIASTGHQIFLREPAGPDCTLAGRHIRAAPVYQQVITELGAIREELPIGEVRGALQDKRIDGVAWSTLGARPYKWHEVSRYLLRPTFGSVTHLLLMNLDTWRQLPPDLQKLLADEGGKLERRAWRRFKKYAADEENQQTVGGMQLSMLCPEQAEKIGTYWAEGVWKVAIDKSGDEARALRDLARKGGLTP